MLRCSSADPLRHRIFDMKNNGVSDGEIVNQIVREEGIVALASPPGEGLGPIVTWVTPGLVLVIGFFVYSAYVRRNRRAPEPISSGDQALMDRFRHELDPDAGDGK
jgi:cytochrome c-type biogenesis protein CcmH/NrfF